MDVYVALPQGRLCSLNLFISNFRVRSNESNENGYKVREAKRLMHLKVHQDGVKLANSLKWRSMVASMG